MGFLRKDFAHTKSTKNYKKAQKNTKKYKTLQANSKGMVVRLNQ